MKKGLSIIFATLALEATAQNIVVNGSFESFGTSITGWSTTEGWTWVNGLSNAADGQAFVALSGNIFQDLPTVPGQAYRLRYALAGDPSQPINPTLETWCAGSLIASTPFDTFGHSNENLGWRYITNTILATAPATRLWFASQRYPAGPGPYLDDVSAVPVDEQPSTCITAPDGIVGWWAGQNNTLDSAGTNHATTPNGVAYTLGKVGTAFAFASTNQFLQIPYSANLSCSNYTIETWIQLWGDMPTTHNPAVIFAQNNGQIQLLAYPGVSGLRIALRFAVDSSTTVGVESASEVVAGNFNHVAATWNGTTLKLYLNGSLDAQSTPGAVPFDSGCPFYIGGIYNVTSGSCSNFGGFFHGTIDEVTYYRRALSDSEISYIYRADSFGKCAIAHPPSFTLQPTDKNAYAGSTVTFTANAMGDAPIGYQWRFNGADLSGQTSGSLTITNVQFPKAGNYSVVAINAAGSTSSSNALLTVLPAPPCVTVTNGLISWWRAEANLFDSWDSNDGAPLSSALRFPFIPFISGKVGQAFNIYSNGVFVTDNPSLRLTNNLTVEGWVSPSNLSGSTLRTIFSKFDAPVGTTTNSSYYLGVSNSFLLFKISANGHTAVSLTTSAPLPLAQWSHVAAAYDGSALRLYLNGTLVAQTSYSGGIFPGTSDVGIGAIPYQQSNWYSLWSGGLDEISLYSRALSDDEILGIYNADLTGKCLAPPMIAVQPQNAVVPLNEDAIFSPKVLGAKPLRYQWRFNGVNIPGASGSRLALEHIQSNNVGDYSFIVTNTVARATSSVATLTLLPPLSCVSAPTGMVAWWPANNFGNDVIGTNNITLTSGPLFGLAGYTTGKVGRCFILSNGVASAASSPDLNVGANADFSIELWYKGSPTNTIGGFQTVSSGTAILRKLSSSPVLPPTGGSGYSLLLDDDGRLSCQLLGLPGGITNGTTFTAPGSDIRDGLFHHLAFTLHRNTIDGGRLYVDGQLLLAFDSRFLGSFSLSNSNALVMGETSVSRLGVPAQRIDELTMYNRALSPAEILSIFQAGSAGKCIPRPTIPVQPTNQLVQAGSNATLRAIASGFPTLNFQWLKNATNLPGATSNSLIISNAAITDAGQYVLTVSNVGGSATSAVATLTINRPPSTSNLNAATIQDQPISIPIAKLLLFASDADGDPLTLSSVLSPSANGGLVSRGATDVTYTPPTGYTGSDSFTYSVSDGRGGFGSASVLVQVRSANDPSGNLLPLTPIPGGFEVSFAGIPGRTYTIQRAETVTGPWSNLTSAIVGPSGIAIFDDTNSPPPTAFYRTVYP